MSIFSVVIAFFKDIPDVKGDKSSSIQTLSVRLGVRGLKHARCCASQLGDAAQPRSLGAAPSVLL